jgi:ATPase subunit of ABC transporter with duplicated ATPase domains
VRQLESALRGYQGAMLVVSHDGAFLANIGITRWLRIDRDGQLAALPGELSRNSRPAGVFGVTAV